MELLKYKLGRSVSMTQEMGLIICILVISSMTIGCLRENERDNENNDPNGSLLVTISIDDNNMDTRDYRTITYRLLNNGSTELRVIPPRFFRVDTIVQIFDSENNTLEWDPWLLNPEKPTDEDLIILKPNCETIMEVSFNNYHFDIESESVYSIRGRYFTEKWEFSLPIWEGELFSETVYVYVS